MNLEKTKHLKESIWPFTWKKCISKLTSFIRPVMFWVQCTDYMYMLFTSMVCFFLLTARALSWEARPFCLRHQKAKREKKIHIFKDVFSELLPIMQFEYNPRLQNTYQRVFWISWGFKKNWMCNLQEKIEQFKWNDVTFEIQTLFGNKNHYDQNWTRL